MKKYVAQVAVTVRIPVEVVAEDEDCASYKVKNKAEDIIKESLNPELNLNSMYAVCSFITEKS